MHFYKSTLLILAIVIETSYTRSFSKEDSWIPRLTKEDLGNYSLVSRIPLTSLYRFNFYRDVAILYYPMPEDVEEVQFIFKAHEEKVSFLGGDCVPQDVDIHIKAKGYPVVSPRNISFPEDFVNDDVRNDITSMRLQSNRTIKSITIKNPMFGDWFGLAFVSWTDPQSDKIEQQGIAAVCDTVLYTDMRVKKVNATVITCNENTPILLSNTTTQKKDFYKFFVENEINNYNVKLSVISKCDSCLWATVRVQGRSLPDDVNNLASCKISLEKASSHNISLAISHYPNEWHYIELVYGEDGAFEMEVTQMKLCTKEQTKESDKLNSTNINLVRDTKSEYFTFEYNLPPNVNDHTPTLLNITSDRVTSMRFNVLPVQDVGGTLSIGATLKLDFKYYMGYKREKNNMTEYYFSQDDPFFKVVVCLSQAKIQIPTVNNTCEVNGAFIPATIVINNTDSDTVSNIVHVPYPEVGTWFMTIRLFCDKDSVCPCPLESDKNNSRYLASSGEGVSEGKYGVRAGSDRCNASVIFSVASSPCLGGKCGRNGMCNFYMSGGFIYSSCSCKGGYAGWDCSDASNVTPSHEILLSTLFLTLSNLLFIPSIYFAIRRRYYTEAVVYFFTMFFSTFYHACDVSDANYSMCIVRLGVLQYSDFFCGLLSFWVTLVAMASLSNTWVSLLHMFGAVMIAFGTELNKQALLVFLIPVATGAVTVMVAWGIRCRQTKKMFPAKAYLILYLPCGLILAAIGLICYAFLQTNANYHIVHSIWHMIIALSILCFLPNRDIFLPKS